MPMMEDGDHTGVHSEEKPLEHIIGHEKSTAGILCLLKTCHGNEASNLLLTKDVLGIVATLGKVDDDNLSRLLSEYLGIETMLAVVYKTFDGVKALETYENDGSISKSFGLHGLGTSIGRHLDGRFQVICLENLRSTHDLTTFLSYITSLCFFSTARLNRLFYVRLGPQFAAFSCSVGLGLHTLQFMGFIQDNLNIEPKPY
ncbi:Protein DEFECTIVE IN MERISTEM SILENCING 3 [Camellia lanceoleosa]|uniref:Protein DEFECTIVE IN MERISTEM SILENCING 3 n=1 Tax=Camellia lanceoleosa TaxID=1840588 RepID=A0ACC0G8T3_9ERIC|nr:Protein DEFECTIVE IN MERISTEM SILENCING 3 [Camellia lanceoleosa]